MTRLEEKRLRRKLLQTFKEAFATYSDKDWESIYSKELSYIKDEGIATLVVAALEWFADEMDKTGPASSTGKYHPASDSGDGGLVRHTKTVVKYALSLLEMERPTSEVLKLKDEIIAAAILHDVAKFDKGTEEQAEIEKKWAEDPNQFRKPILISSATKEYKEPVGGFDSYMSANGKHSFSKVGGGWWKCNLAQPPVDGWESVVDEKGEQCTKVEKPIVYCKNDHPKRMADFVRTMETLFPLPNYSQIIEDIADLVETHEGRFNTSWFGNSDKPLWKNPEEISNEILQKASKIVHTADYVAARSYGDYAFDDNGDIIEGPQEVKKAQRKSFLDDSKEEIDELKAEIEDLQTLVDNGGASERDIKSLERSKKLLKKLLGESRNNKKRNYTFSTIQENNKEIKMKRFRESVEPSLVEELLNQIGYSGAEYTDNEDGTVEVEKEIYRIMSSDTAFQMEREFLEEIMSSPEEIRAFFDNPNNGFREEFLVDYFASDMAMDLNDSEELDPIDSDDFDTIVDTMSEDYCKDLVANNPNYLDFNKITEYVVDSDGFMLLSPYDGKVYDLGDDSIAVREE